MSDYSTPHQPSGGQGIRNDDVSDYDYDKAAPTHGDAYYNGDKLPSQRYKGIHLNAATSLQVADPATDSQQTFNEIAAANKTLRTATAFNAFWLICTDLLAPAQAPYGIATLGYVGGTLMFVVLGGVFGYAGWILHQLYMYYNTDAMPIRSYGDLMEHVFGRYGPRARALGRWMTVFLQCLLLWLDGAVGIVYSAQAMYQLSNNNVCFIAFAAVFAAACCLVCCMRQLKSISFLAIGAVTLNCVIVFATIGVASATPPLLNIADAAPSSLFQSGFIATDENGNGLAPHTGVAFANLPFAVVNNGISNIVYAWGGGTLVIEIMAELKDPRSFMRPFIAAMTMLAVLYLSIGLSLYALQGPYVGNPANQGLSSTAWQNALNIITILSVVVSASMYLSIGMKVFYSNVLVDLLGAPPLPTNKGWACWIALSFFAWWTAFCISEVIPQFSSLNGIVSALLIVQFSYSLPALMHIMHQVAEDRQAGADTLMKQLGTHTIQKSVDMIILLGALAFAGMGAYGSIEVFISALNSGSTAIFACNGA